MTASLLPAAKAKYTANQAALKANPNVEINIGPRRMPATTAAPSPWPTSPPSSPSVANRLSGIAGLRRYHELPSVRSIWRQVEIAGLPEGMITID